MRNTKKRPIWISQPSVPLPMLFHSLTISVPPAIANHIGSLQMALPPGAAPATQNLCLAELTIQYKSSRASELQRAFQHKASPNSPNLSKRCVGDLIALKFSAKLYTSTPMLSVEFVPKGTQMKVVWASLRKDSVSAPCPLLWSVGLEP